MTNVVKSWETNGKMDLQAINKPNSGHYIFQWSNGGEIPQDEINSIFEKYKINPEQFKVLIYSYEKWYFKRQ